MSLIDVKDAADRLGMKEDTLRHQIHRGVRYGQFFEVVDGKQVIGLGDLIGCIKKKPRLKKIGVRFNDVELARLKANAGGQDLAGYIRGRVL